MAPPTGVVNGEDDAVKAWLRSKVPHVVRELVAGGAAGAIAKTCVAPLERTKILLMTGRSRGSALSTLQLIVATEGVGGLFRGNTASCLRIMPYAAIHFSVYEAYRRMLAEHFLPTPAAAVMGATGTAGGTAAGSTEACGGVTSAGGAPPRAAEQLLSSTQHLGEDVPPTPMSSSIDVSATAVITTVEEEQRGEEEEDEEEELHAGPPGSLQPAASLPPGTPEAAVAVPHAQDGAVAAHHSQQHITNHHHHHHHHHHHQRRRLGPILDLVAGSAAGATAVILTYPLDVIRTRMAWAMDGASRTAAGPGAAAASAISAGAGAASAAATASEEVPTKAPVAGRTAAHHNRIGTMLVYTVRHEGLLGLYRGLAPTLYGIMPYAGLKFFVYGSLKQWYRDSLHSPSAAAGLVGPVTHGHGGGSHAHGERLPVPYMLAFGGVSGLLAQTVTYPLDVIRRRMQVYGIQQETAAELGVVGASGQRLGARLTTWAVGMSIVRQEGPRGLFRGLSLNYVKVVPSTAIGFTVYDMFKSYLGVTGNM